MELKLQDKISHLPFSSLQATEKNSILRNQRAIDLIQMTIVNQHHIYCTLTACLQVSTTIQSGMFIKIKSICTLTFSLMLPIILSPSSASACWYSMSRINLCSEAFRGTKISPPCLVLLSTFTCFPEEGAEFYPFHWWRWQRLLPHKASGIRQNPTTTYYCHQDHNHHPASLPVLVVILTEIWVSKERLPRAKHWSLDNITLPRAAMMYERESSRCLEVVPILGRPSCPFPTNSS